MVDGAPIPATVLTLSHWPATPTPVALRADLSVESALRWRECPGRWAGAELVSTDHLDQDGLASVFALVDPEGARRRRDRLVGVARAGDFATFTERDAARVSFALAAMADPQRSSVAAGVAAGELTAELLGRLGDLVDHPDRHAAWWEDEDASLTAAEALIASGKVAIEEVAALDLALVSIPEGAPARLATRFMARADAPCHPAAIHNATACGRLLIRQGARFELVMRYESWVRLVSRRPAARVDLAPLAARLEAEEPNAVGWFADEVSSLVQRMSLVGSAESGLAPSRVRELVEDHLRNAPPAWFPASEGRPTAPPRTTGR